MSGRSFVRRGATWLIAYLIVLSLIGFWPQHVDRGFSGPIRWLVDVIPLLTYQRLEFGANILLFVPFGFLLGTMLRKQLHLVVPLAFLSSLLIESVQAIALAGRTPAVMDLVANTAGACVGLVALAVFDLLRARTGRGAPHGYTGEQERAGQPVQTNRERWR